MMMVVMIMMMMMNNNDKYALGVHTRPRIPEILDIPGNQESITRSVYLTHDCVLGL